MSNFIVKSVREDYIPWEVEVGQNGTRIYIRLLKWNLPIITTQEGIGPPIRTCQTKRDWSYSPKRIDKALTRYLKKADKLNAKESAVQKKLDELLGIT